MSNPGIRFALVASVLVVLSPAPVLALPDDQQQEVIVNAGSSEFFLDDGIVIHYGSQEQPAVITQGSLKVSGTKIIIERKNDQVTRITATGMPARFQQQPEVDKGVIYASGQNIVYDSNRLLTIDENAEFIQEGNTISGHHIEYDVQARTAKASGGDSEDRVNMSIAPANN